MRREHGLGDWYESRGPSLAEEEGSWRAECAREYAEEEWERELRSSVAQVLAWELDPRCSKWQGGALAEVLPNLGQNVGGALIGIPLFYAVRKAYPPILRLGKPRSWQEN